MMSSFRSDSPVNFASLRDSLRAELYLGVTRLWALLGGLLSPRALRPMLLPVRSRHRGAGMLEYALVAALAVGVFLILRQFFSGLFTNVTKDINDNLKDPVNTPIQTPIGGSGG